MKAIEFISEAERFPDVRTYSPSELARKHGVPLKEILAQLRMGIKVELEHTNDDAMAIEIALDHLLEKPDYYTRLANAKL